MSRSQPHDGAGARNPASRFHEWQGEHGVLRYWDRDAKITRDVGLPFTCLLLDQLATIKGWHEGTQSGIYANEVKDTRQSAFVVKAFKGGVLAEGFYRDIKDRIGNLGGHYVANLYVAFRPEHDADLAIGAVQFKGAALRAWMEFTAAHRGRLYTDAIQIAGYTEGKKGRIVYRMPSFRLLPASEETQKQALGLDAVLQTYLNGYLKRPTTEQATAAHDTDDDPPPPSDADAPVSIDDDSVPF